MNTLAKDIAEKNAGAWRRMNGHHARMNVYNQRPDGLTTDLNYCAGCAVANVYQAQTGTVGDFAQSLYEATKRSPEAQAAGTDDRTGSTLKAVCIQANKQWGGEHARLTTLAQVASWLDTVGPVALGLQWTLGMEHPTGRGNWWSRHFGPRWMTATSAVVSQHAVTILGGSYHDGGFLWAENSRGPQWGNKGLARLPWMDTAWLLRSGQAYAYGLTFDD